MTSVLVRYFAGEDGHRFRHRSTLAPGPTVRVGQSATESNDICGLGREDWNRKVIELWERRFENVPKDHEGFDKV